MASDRPEEILGKDEPEDNGREPLGVTLAEVAHELRDVAITLKSQGALRLEDIEQLNAIFDSLAAGDGDELLDTSLTELASLSEEKAESSDIRTRLRDMGIPQKVKLAMFGNATCRMLLISDSNRMVQEAVLKNPQIQEREIQDFSKNTNVSENVLRRISDSKTWMKNYQIKVCLCLNPKTPQDVSLKWLRYLRTQDLKRVAGSRNIPQTIATSAKKRLAEGNK